MFAEEGWAAGDGPRALGELVGGAGIDDVPVELGVVDGDLHPAIDEVRVFEGFLGAVDDADLEAEVLGLDEEVVGSQARGEQVERLAAGAEDGEQLLVLPTEDIGQREALQLRADEQQGGLGSSSSSPSDSSHW